MKVIPILIEVIDFLKAHEVGCYRVDSPQASSRGINWVCASKEAELIINRSGIIILESQDRHLIRVYLSTEEFKENWRSDILPTIEKDKHGKV